MFFKLAISHMTEKRLFVTSSTPRRDASRETSPPGRSWRWRIVPASSTMAHRAEMAAAGKCSKAASRSPAAVCRKSFDFKIHHRV